MRPIVMYGDPILAQKATPIGPLEFNRDLSDLATEMQKIMKAANGVGLAAPQIGISKAFCVLSVEHTLGPPFMANPVIEEHSSESQKLSEGCLSAPGFFYPGKRPVWVAVRYQDLVGREKTLRAEGFLARVVMHETDHLKGKLFFTRKRPDQKAVMQAFRKWQKESGLANSGIRT